MDIARFRNLPQPTEFEWECKIVVRTLFYMSLLLTVGPRADVKNGFTWKIIFVLKVRGGHGE